MAATTRGDGSNMDDENQLAREIIHISNRSRPLADNPCPGARRAVDVTWTLPDTIAEVLTFAADVVAQCAHLEPEARSADSATLKEPSADALDRLRGAKERFYA